MTDQKKPMTPEEAYKIVTEFASRKRLRAEFNEASIVGEALATLDGLRAHFSRFRFGAQVWIIWGGEACGPWPVIGVTGIGRVFISWFGPIEESNCFTTRELAEAECERRKTPFINQT